MKKETIQTTFELFESADALSEMDARLLMQARESLEQAYAPYSRFQVGAAALLEDGQILRGANQENASFPLALCAERVALAAVESLFPNRAVVAMAITVRYGIRPVLRPAAPCGACRQVIAEKEYRQGQPMRLILQGEDGPVYVFASGRDLLPLTFDPDYL